MKDLLDIVEWLRFNINISNHKEGADWSVLFGTVTCLLRKWRNESIFAANNPPFVWRMKTFIFVGDYKLAVEAARKLQVTEVCHEANMIRWKRPESGWVKLNLDGALIR